MGKKSKFFRMDRIRNLPKDLMAMPQLMWPDLSILAIMYIIAITLLWLGTWFVSLYDYDHDSGVSVDAKIALFFTCGGAWLIAYLVVSCQDIYNKAVMLKVASLMYTGTGLLSGIMLSMTNASTDDDILHEVRELRGYSIRDWNTFGNTTHTLMFADRKLEAVVLDNRLRNPDIVFLLGGLMATLMILMRPWMQLYEKKQIAKQANQEAASAGEGI